MVRRDIFGRGGVKRWLRVGLTIALVAALIFIVDWPAAWAAARGAAPEWLAAALVCVVAARLTITIRWALLLRAGGRDVSLRRLFIIVSAGIGMGSLLPTSVGPDVARGWLLHRQETRERAPQARARMETTVTSVVLDRYLATIGTVVVAIGGAAALGQTTGVLLLTACLATILGGAAALLVAAGPAIHRLTPGPLARARPKLESLLAAVRTPGMLRRGAAPATIVAICTTLLRIGAFLCVYQALGWPVPFALACFAIPLTLMALMIPISIGGFGVREGMLVVGFESAGIPAAVSVTAGVLFFALQMIASLPSIAQTVFPRSHAPAGQVAPTPQDPTAP